MIEVPLRAMNSSLLKSSAMLDTLAGMGDSSGMFPVFDNAPLYLKESLLFPYRDGVRFQQAALEKLGTAAFARVLRAAPVSTQQVIHPELYFEGRTPARVTLPEWRARGWKRSMDGDFSELDHRILFALSDKAGAAEAAAAWRGGRFEMWEQAGRKAAGLRWTTQWASEEAARRALALYARNLKRKWPAVQMETDTGEAVTGRVEGAPVEMRRRGAAVEGLERLPSR
jgi:hypothetical protein